MTQKSDFYVNVLGELQVSGLGVNLALPASRKARALLAFLVSTNRPHRRERLCELFWDLPDDPKASLRWALTKLRKVVDTANHQRIVADRERVRFDCTDACVDLHELRARLGNIDAMSVADLEDAATRLGYGFLEGIDGAGDSAFENWLIAERLDVQADLAQVLKHLTRHPNLQHAKREKWVQALREVDPDIQIDAAINIRPEPKAEPVPLAPEQRRTHLREQRIGFCTGRDGTAIAYATVGTGAPVVKAANWLTHIEHDWNTPIWGASFADIARDRTLVRYDERGCGLSDWEVKKLDFDAFVEDLETVVDKLGLERFPLIGISQGASVSIEYAVRHPERVSGLILIGGYAAGWRHHADDEEIARRKAVRDLTEVGWGTDNPAYRHIFSQTFMPDAAFEELAWFDQFQKLTTSAINAARFQEAFGDIDVRDRLAYVEAPTIVLHAVNDRRIPVSEGRKIAANIPNARFVPLESQNHVLVDYEPAWRECMRHIHQFLDELGG